MNYLNTLVAVVLLTMGSACASEDELDMSFDGIINTEALNELVNGNCAYDCLDLKIFEKGYEEYVNGTGEWEWQDCQWGRSSLLGSWIIIDGLLIEPIILPSLSDPLSNCFETAWTIYCKQSGYNKVIATGRTIAVDKENFSLLTRPISSSAESSGDNDMNGALKYRIHKADNKYLAVSIVFPEQRLDENGELICNRVSKYDLLYKKTKAKPQRNQYNVFENEGDAKLWMLKTMREYFGDTIDVYKYTSQGEKDRIIDLAEFENWINRSLKFQSDL
ncbi:MAG: hypothetical protein K2L77_07070 [Muribaculaceae bacterium]|nr:hypothetical protein [Muribaculaceae bacterium]